MNKSIYLALAICPFIFGVKTSKRLELKAQNAENNSVRIQGPTFVKIKDTEENKAIPASSRLKLDKALKKMSTRRRPRKDAQDAADQSRAAEILVQMKKPDYIRTTTPRASRTTKKAKAPKKESINQFFERLEEKDKKDAEECEKLKANALQLLQKPTPKKNDFVALDPKEFWGKFKEKHNIA